MINAPLVFRKAFVILALATIHLPEKEYLISEDNELKYLIIAVVLTDTTTNTLNSIAAKVD